MERTRISLKALEVFLSVARRGALRDAAETLGISTSTASHHIGELEKIVGLPLFDHARRPMQLTPAGQILRRRAEDALAQLRRGLSEIRADDLGTLVRLLRIALIEDFDADVGPALAETLVRKAPNCEFSFLSRPTHEILDLLESRQIDIGVATTSDFHAGGIVETPLLRDPFVLVLPTDHAGPPDMALDALAADTDLPFLRYSGRQLLGRRIEAQLRRMALRLPRRMEFETTHAILSLVAANRGWTVTTALSFARAQRHHTKLRIQPFPGSAFAREIAVFTRDDVPEAMAQLTKETLVAAIRRMAVEPTCARYPWLAERFRLLPRREAARATATGSGTEP